MRKLYSLVLIAAGLLIGTNSWADQVQVAYKTGTYAENPRTFVGGTALQDAVGTINKGDSAVITLLDDQHLSSVVTLDGQKICLDLAGNEVKESSTSGKGCFKIRKGTLHVTGSGTINHSVYGTASNVARSAITVFGAPYAQRETENWSLLIIDENVLVTTNSGAKQYGITLDAASLTGGADPGTPYVTYAASTLSCAIDGKLGCAYGVKILVKGTVYGYQRGINIAGNINATPECGNDGKFPYIKIYPTAEVSCYTDNLSSGNGGIYAGGYCKIDVSGNVHGQTGILVKSGDITLTDATVASDSEQTKANGNYGGDVAGTGIFIASDQSYGGNVGVKIEGATTVTSGTGTGSTAIIDVYADNSTNNTQVSHIQVTGGTIEGDIKLTSTTGAVTQVTGGQLPETITVGSNENYQTANLVPTGTTVHTTTVKDPETGEKTIIISAGEAPTTLPVVLNDYYLATFSATETVEIPTGSDLKVYTAGALNGENLELYPVTSSYIPAGTGVILYNEANNEKNFALTVYNGEDPISALLGTNNLKPATAWRVTETDVYILHGSELWQYTGTEFKANKAYLKLPTSNVAPGPNQAPARISLRFNQTEQTTAIENVAPEAVKAVKFVGEDGKLYIRRGEAVYTVQGQLVK